MRVLGIDPGTVNLGYALVESNNEDLSLIDSGVLKVSAKIEVSQRLNQIFTSLSGIIEKSEPSEMAVEAPFVSQNVRTAMLIGRAQAVAILSATQNNLEVFTYAPTQIKKSVTDNGGSSKEQVRDMVEAILNIDKQFKDLDESDAVAVALCHMKERETQELMLREI